MQPLSALAIFAALALLAVGVMSCGGQPAGEAANLDTAGRAVMLVANAEAGTVSVIDARSFAVLHSLDVIPDGPDASLGDDPVQAALGQRIVEYAGGDNFAQDLDIAPDGRRLYVSRGHRGDVAAFDLASDELLWKTAIDGVRADHMTIDAAGERLYVSSLTIDQLYVLDAGSGAVLGSVSTGQWPHDNHLSQDGRLLYNASIGNILSDEATRAVLAMNPQTSPYVVTVIDTGSLQAVDRHYFEHGVRPFLLNAEETHMYTQLSQWSGVIEYEFASRQVTRRLALPVAEGTSEEDYDFEAPHHGVALSADGKTLCLAGRISDYAALVDVQRFEVTAIVPVGDAPSWSATSPDGRHCFVANNRDATVSVIDYQAGAEVARIEVDAGPKFVMPAVVPAELVTAWAARR